MSMSREHRDVVARKAFAALGASPSEKATLQVACGRSHHLAAVYETGEGLVYHTILKTKAHGDKDLYDSGHHASRLGVDWFDLLDAGVGPAVDAALPAGCECGPYTLSRSDLLDAIGRRTRKVVVD